MVKITKKKSRNHEYFDSDCYNKKKKLKRLANLLEKNPDNLTIKQSYHQTKRLYKIMIKSKKREHKELKLKLIASLKPNEIKRKWEIIKSVTDSTFEYDPAEGIHIDRWKTYFEKLGTNREEDDCLQTDFSMNQNMISIDENKSRTMKSDHNKLFTNEEIMQGKDILKNGKSTGIDGVRN